MKRRSNTQQNVLLIYIVPELTCVLTRNSHVYSYRLLSCNIQAELNPFGHASNSNLPMTETGVATPRRRQTF